MKSFTLESSNSLQVYFMSKPELLGNVQKSKKQIKILIAIYVADVPVVFLTSFTAMAENPTENFKEHMVTL